MDLPIHLATGALVGNVILYVEQTASYDIHTSHQQIKVGTACFLLGVLSHLFWDAVPHYDWLFYIEIFKPLPFWWHIPQVFVAFPVVLFTWYVMRDHPVIAMISLLGGIYPDLEKLAYFDFHLPRELVIFRRHSCYLSQWRPWEFEHKTFLIVFEVLLLPTLLLLTYWITCQRHKQSEFFVPTPHPSQEGKESTPHPSQEGKEPTPHPSQEGKEPTPHPSQEGNKSVVVTDKFPSWEG